MPASSSNEPGKGSSVMRWEEAVILWFGNALYWSHFRGSTGRLSVKDVFRNYNDVSPESFGVRQLDYEC